MSIELSDNMKWILFIYATKFKNINYQEPGISNAMNNVVKTIDVAVAMKCLIVKFLKYLQLKIY